MTSKNERPVMSLREQMELHYDMWQKHGDEEEAFKTVAIWACEAVLKDDPEDQGAIERLRSLRGECEPN